MIKHIQLIRVFGTKMVPSLYMSSVMKKTLLYAYAKTKTQISCMVTAQLITDQCLRFCYKDSTISQLPKPLTIFCGPTVGFVSDLVGNPADRFSLGTAHTIPLQLTTESSSNKMKKKNNILCPSRIDSNQPGHPRCPNHKVS